MLGGLFEWKQALFGSRIRVEFTNGSVTRTANNAVKTIELNDIKAVYIYHQNMWPLLHMLNIDLETTNGDRMRFGVSGYGPPIGKNLRECRKATIALMQHLEETQSDAPIYKGLKPTAKYKLLIVGMYAFVIIFAAIQTLRVSPPEDLAMTISAIGIVSLFMAGAGWLHLRKIGHLKSLSAKAVRETLEEDRRL